MLLATSNLRFGYADPSDSEEGRRTTEESHLQCHSEPFDCRSRQAKVKNLTLYKKMLHFTAFVLHDNTLA